MEMVASQELAGTMKKGVSTQYLEILQTAEQIVIRECPYKKSLTRLPMVRLKYPSPISRYRGVGSHNSAIRKVTLVHLGLLRLVAFGCP